MKHFVGLMILLGITVCGHYAILRAYARAESEHTSVAVLSMPEFIGDYEKIGEDAEVDEHVKKVLGTTAILMRDYGLPPNRRIQLTLVHSSSRRSLHFPEVCLVGAGWEIREQSACPVGFYFNAKKLVLVKGELRQAVLYWFKTEDEFTGNFFVNALFWVKRRIQFGSPASTMIKVTTVLGPEQNEEQAFQGLQDFAIKVTPVLRKQIP